MRAKQGNKKKSKESYRDSLMKWHATTRERLIRCGRNESYDEKWGRFTPEQRFNVDQSPLPFALNSKRTYELVKRGDKYHRVDITTRKRAGKAPMYPSNLLHTAQTCHYFSW